MESIVKSDQSSLNKTVFPAYHFDSLSHHIFSLALHNTKLYYKFCIIKKPHMLDALFIICLSTPTATKLNIMGTETLSILLTFYSQNTDYINAQYIFGE